jgi:hypothetical protein
MGRELGCPARESARTSSRTKARFASSRPRMAAPPSTAPRRTAASGARRGACASSPRASEPDGARAGARCLPEELTEQQRQAVHRALANGLSVVDLRPGHEQHHAHPRAARRRPSRGATRAAVRADRGLGDPGRRRAGAPLPRDHADPQPLLHGRVARASRGLVLVAQREAIALGVGRAEGAARFAQLPALLDGGSERAARP